MYATIPTAELITMRDRHTARLDQATPIGQEVNVAQRILSISAIKRINDEIARRMPPMPVQGAVCMTVEQFKTIINL